MANITATDSRPTKPITIDGVSHQIHIKPVLGEAGPFDLYDIWEVHALIALGIYEDNLESDPHAWRMFRQYHQNGPSMYKLFQMAPFTFPSDVPLIPHWTRTYVTEEGVYDFINWVQSGEWNEGNEFSHFPVWGEPPFHESSPGFVIYNIHSPAMDRLRAQGATEEEIYQTCLDDFHEMQKSATGEPAFA